MTAPEYEPGTVAVATVRGVEGVRVFRLANGWWVSAHTVNGYRLHDDVTDVRPLVVIDPEDREDAKRLWRAYANTDPRGLSQGADFMQAALRSLTAPPRPPEPQGLGAVVEDADGQRWVRFKQAEILPWRLNHPGDTDSARRAYYRDLPVARVLSEGVS